MSSTKHNESPHAFYRIMETLVLIGFGLLLLISQIEGLAGSSPPRRPPRIRPRRQSPSTSSSDSDFNTGGGSSNHNKSKATGNDREELMVRRHEQALQDPSLLTTVRFSDRTDIHPDTRRALEEGFGLRAMTRVQAETYGAALEGRSILARSRTGTGKTLAFLLPTIERLLDSDLDLYQPGRSIGCVILAPTRELAIQIADQAEILFDYHNKQRPSNKQLSVACIYGGVKMQRDVRLLTGGYRGAGLPTILVATPARLLEHLEGNSPLNKNHRYNRNHQQEQRSKNSFADVVADTKIVVLDETDRLLQKSNQYETQKILGFMARAEKRQTLLFSATIPRAVRRLISTSSVLNKKVKHNNGRRERKDDDATFLEVDCIGNENDRPDDTAPVGDKQSPAAVTLDAEIEGSPDSVHRQRIEETFAVLENMSQFIPALLAIIRREKQRDSQNYKILVFFPAGRIVRFMFQFFTIGGIEGKNNIWEIHSRMSQSSRTRASAAFRNARNGILFSSDVSARGLDYPDISLVVQMGAPSSDQDYIHRIGRTGRAGQVGRSLLVLLPFERQKKEQRRQKGGNKKRPGKVSYRNDASIKQDRQLSSWLNECGHDDHEGMSSSKSLYQKCQDDLESTRLKVRSGHVVLTTGAEAAYKTFLAHYVATIKPPNKSKSGTKQYTNRGNSVNNLKPSEVLVHAEDFARGTGLADAPQVEETFLSKLGLL